MTDEMKVSHTFRRLTVIAQQFGDADHHLERFAARRTAARHSARRTHGAMRTDRSCSRAARRAR
jgi:hypothetical protein